MPNLTPRKWMLAAAAVAGLAGAAAAQDVQSGIAAWQAGDYGRAVSEWRPLADAGNADAQFNLAQAYRLGRGVPQNLNLAEQWFERAARQRHEQAGASLGLLLFQNGRAREAMPWLQAAATRGDPRAQYVFGTALFNGDIVRRDLPRAYAMMSAAAAQGFPQAQAQLAEMDRQLSPEDRERGRAMASNLSAPPAPQVASAERPSLPPQAAPTTPRTAPQRPGSGVSYAHPPAQGPYNPPHTPPESRPPVQVEAPPVRPERPADTPRTEQPVRPAASGGWRVQLGAFSSDANARRLWDDVRGRVAALRDLQVSFPRSGAITRVRAGPLANRGEADRLCAAVRAAGKDCIPVRP